MNHFHWKIEYLDVGSQPFLATLYFLIGHFFTEKKIPLLKPWLIAVAFSIVIIGGFFWRMDMDAQLYCNKKLIPSIITAILGTWCVYSLPWEGLKGKCAAVLQFIGNNTLTILTWHFLAFKFVSFIIICIYHQSIERLAEFPILSDFAKQGWWAVYTVVAIITISYIIHCYNKTISY